LKHLERQEPQEAHYADWLELQAYVDGELEPARLSEVNRLLQEAGHESIPAEIL
jgi:anti-sigma factor RsiW